MFPAPVLTPFDAMIEQINAHLKGNDLSFVLSAPITVPVLRKDNTYRQIAMVGNEEFFIKGVRGGSGDKLLFEFVPVDAKDYSQAEFNEKIVFQAFGDVIFELLRAALEIPEDVPWTKGRAQWLKDYSRTKTKKIEKEAREAYEDNPVWGSF